MALGGVDMKMKIGFNIGESKRENTENIVNTVAPEVVADEPVRSVATVRFENGKEYPYYNDEFNLKVGDVVFVMASLQVSRAELPRLPQNLKSVSIFTSELSQISILNFTASSKDFTA